MAKNTAGNLLLLIFASASAFLLAELGFRTYLFGAASLSFRKVNSVHGIGRAGLLQRSDDKEIVFELKPNLDTLFKLARFKLARLRTNSSGLRDEEYSLAKPANTVRVAVIGDSFTMPSGVEIEEAFHSRIEDRLNEEGRGHEYQFLNFADELYRFLDDNESWMTMSCWPPAVLNRR